MKILAFILPILFLLNCKPAKSISTLPKNVVSPPTFSYTKSESSNSLIGHIAEEESKDPVIYGSIGLYQNEVLVTGAETDFDGNYLFSDLKNGVYEMEISYLGFYNRKITNVLIKENHQTIMNATIANRVNLEDIIILNCGFPPIIEQDDFTKGRFFYSDEIRRTPISKSN